MQMFSNASDVSGESLLPRGFRFSIRLSKKSSPRPPFLSWEAPSSFDRLDPACLAESHTPSDNIRMVEINKVLDGGIILLVAFVACCSTVGREMFRVLMIGTAAFNLIHTCVPYLYL